MQLKSYTVTSSVDYSGGEPAGNEVEVLTGTGDGTIVKPLERSGRESRLCHP